MVTYSTSVALVRSLGPLGGLRSNVCVDEDIRNSDKEILVLTHHSTTRPAYLYHISGIPSLHLLLNIGYRGLATV
jgi:hypothetical protein